jgi:hypothetical protein
MAIVKRRCKNKMTLNTKNHNNSPLKDLLPCKRNGRKLLSTLTGLMEDRPPWPQRRRVHFVEQPPVVYPIEDHVRPEEEDQVWYNTEYLLLARKEEIKSNLRAQHHDDDDSDASLTWRGMEDVLEGCGRTTRVAAHVRAVLRRHDRHRNAVLLRRFSRALSKHDRHRAKEMAAKDAQVAQPCNCQLPSAPTRKLSPLIWRALPARTMPWRLLAHVGNGNSCMDSISSHTLSSDHEQ